MLVIKEPYWKYKGFGLNVADFRFSDKIRVECTYKDKNGRRVFPHIYEVNKAQVFSAIERGYIHKAKGKVLLAVIPVVEMEVIQYRQPDFEKENKDAEIRTKAN